MRDEGLLAVLALLALGMGGGSGPSFPMPTKGRMTLAQLRSLAAHLGFPDPALAAAIAMAESGGDPAATAIVVNPSPGFGPERSFGLWQVNTLAHPQYSETQLLDPTYCGQAALAISKGGTDWSPWSTFTSGAYKRFMGG